MQQSNVISFPNQMITPNGPNASPRKIMNFPFKFGQDFIFQIWEKHNKSERDIRLKLKKKIVYQIFYKQLIKINTNCFYFNVQPSFHAIYRKKIIMFLIKCNKF